MAKVKTPGGMETYMIREWLGLNENPDGDTGLKLGEAAEMRNFRITRDNHLQIRPGYAPVCTLAEGCPVRGIWEGYVAGVYRLLCACGGRLWEVSREDWSRQDLGEIGERQVSFFGFAQKVYLLTGDGYFCWDGSGEVRRVEGYIPIVATATPPEGGGRLLEAVNKLTGKRRQQFSPNGEAVLFQLCETQVDEVLEVEGTDLAWTADPEEGTVTFSQPPDRGTNTLTVTWRKGEGDRRSVETMRFAELYNGSADSRVFLYGDGSNQTLYSGLDQWGVPTAEYFPDLNTLAVDSANTPITALIRHYDSLLIFKSDGAYSCRYDTLTLEDGSVTAAFYTTPLNREIGCAAPGQARLVDNDPLTLFGRGVYRWSLSSAASRDERNARRLSDRVEHTLSGFDLERAITFDDEEEREFYIGSGEKYLVYNYGNDTWYAYTDLPAACMVKVGGELYFGTGEGRLMHFSREYRNDDKRPIDAHWESGSINFGRSWRVKYASHIWASMKPESQAVVTLTAQTNVRSDYPQRVVASGLANFFHASFAHWSFGTNRKPQVVRAGLKVRKATYYKLILSSCSSSATATILSVDIRVRQAGMVT